MKRFSNIEQQIRDLISELSQYKDLYSAKSINSVDVNPDEIMIQLTGLLAEVNHKRMMYFKMRNSSLFDYSDLPIDGYADLERKFIKIKADINSIKKTA